VPKAFRQKLVAIKPAPDDGLYDVVFRTTRIATIDLRHKDSQSQPVTDVPSLNSGAEEDDALLLERILGLIGTFEAELLGHLP